MGYPVKVNPHRHCHDRPLRFQRVVVVRPVQHDQRIAALDLVDDTEDVREAGRQISQRATGTVAAEDVPRDGVRGDLAQVRRPVGAAVLSLPFVEGE